MLNEKSLKTNKSPEKSKGFQGSLRRLIKELTAFKKIIIISIIFALLGTFLSVITPNKLSDLTDEIAEGLIIQHDNLEYLIEKTNEDINTEIEIDDVIISIGEQKEFKKIMSTIDDSSSDMEIYSKIDNMPETIKKVVMPYMDMSEIKKMTLILVVIYVGSAICMYVQGENMAEVVNQFAENLRKRISSKINNLPLKYYDKHLSGDILSRTTNDIDTIAQSMNQAFENLLSSIIMIIGTIIMMFITNWIMALTTMLSCIFGMLLTNLILRKSQKYFVSRQKELGELNNHIEETYSNMRIVKSYNGKRQAVNKFEKLNKKVYQANRKSQFLSGLLQPLMEFIGNFGYVAVCIVGAILTFNNTTSFGVIIAFIAYVELFTSSFTQIAQSVNFLQSTVAASYRVFEFLDAREVSKENNLIESLDKDDVKGKIEFENVNFKYHENDLLIIKDLTTCIEPGKKVAIIGPIGAGKTTLMKLLLKFYEVDSGDIKIDGISLKNLKRENVHKICTMLFQEPWLFNGTIRENIVYNRENISDDKIKEICNELGLNEFIDNLPNGLDTRISDKYNVSVGQKQLIAIARGMIEDAPILILDEATSNLDLVTEKMVQKVFDKLAKNKTIIMISHRLESIKDFDTIIFLKNGKIVEQGNHEELIKKNGEYAKSYNLQMSLKNI